MLFSDAGTVLPLGRAAATSYRQQHLNDGKYDSNITWK